MKTRVALVVAVLLIVWLTAVLVRVENERYALQLGMCWNEQLKLPDMACIQKAETRTGWWWHLRYAIKE